MYFFAIKNGKVHSVASVFSAQRGMTISSLKNAEFYDFLASRQVPKDDRTIGIFYKAEEAYDEYVIPTLISDPERVALMSDQDVIARGLLVYT